MSYAGFKICQAFATADVLVISFLGIDISKTFLRYKYTILFFISPILLVASRRCYAISERTGSNQHYGSDEITIICHLCKFSTFSNICVLLHQCEVCIYFHKFLMYLYLQCSAGIRTLLSGKACACVFCPYQARWPLFEASTYILCPSVCSYEASREPLVRFS